MLQKQIIDFLSIHQTEKEGFGLAKRSAQRIKAQQAAQAEQAAEQILIALNEQSNANFDKADKEKTAAEELNEQVAQHVENISNAKNDNDFSSILIASDALKKLYDALVVKSDTILKLYRQQETIYTQASELQKKYQSIKIDAKITQNKYSVGAYDFTVQQYRNNAEKENSKANILKSSAPFLVAAPFANDDTIKKQNDELDATFSTKYTQIIYQEERNKTAKLVVYWANIVYYILACILVYFLIFSEKTATMVWQYKLLYTITIGVFPYVIVSIELFFKQVVEMLYLTTLGKPYEPSKWKIMGEPEFMKKSPGYGIPEEGGA